MKTISLAAFISVLASMPAYAAEPPAADTATGDILVTARKRTELLREVPASVIAVTGDSLAQQGARSLTQIGSVVPGITFTAVNATLPTISIRGNGNRTGGLSTGSDLPVSVFTDGVYVPRNSQLSYEPLDVERVEVIKGPQGTIYGRNTIAGAINVVTKNPTNKLEGEATASIGTSSQSGDYLWGVKGVISGPIIDDRLMVRLAASHSYRAGYVKVLPIDERAFGDNSEVVRFKALALLTDQLKFNLTLEYANKHATPVQQALFDPGTTNPLATAIPSASYLVLPNLYTAYNNDPATLFVRSFRAVGRFDWTTTLGTLSSISSFEKDRQRLFWDVDGTEKAINTDDNTGKTKNFSEEVRLAGDSNGWTWSLGGFYFHETGYNSAYRLYFAQSPFPGRIQTTTTGVDTHSYAAFGQLGYDITSKLNLSVGLRYSKDKKNEPFSIVRNAVVFLTRARQASWDSFDKGVTLKYKITPLAMVYASYNSGFRAGGFNDPTAPTVAAPIYDPEKVDAYEIGFKGSFLNHRIGVELAGFENRYRDLQLNGSVPDPNNASSLIFAVTNAGKSNVKGVELALTERPIPHVTLGQSWSYTDARIDQYTVLPGSGLPDITGLRNPRVPKNSLLFSAGYDFDLAGGKMSLNAQYQHIDGYPSELDPRVGINGVLASAPLPGRDLVNAQISYDIGTVRIEASVRNLFDKEYIDTQRKNGPNFVRFITPGEPQTWQLSVTKTF